MDATLAIAIFVGTYLVIASDRVHKTPAALAGAVLMVVFGVLDQQEAFAAIDLNVIFLLLGMMAIANIMRGTGIFQWLGIRAARVSGASPWRLLVMLTLLTAVASAFLDNVTTVVLVAPITLYLASALGISPVPYLVCQILASNIGGTATLIGDPPNILIASAAGIDFGTFLVNMAPVATGILVAFVGLSWLMFRGEMRRQRDQLGSLDLDESGMIRNPRVARLSVIVLAGTIVGFLVAGPLGFEPATIALAGATTLLITSRVDPSEVLAEVEWTTLLFFAGLFIVVEGLIATGVIAGLARGLVTLTGGDLNLTTMAILWVSAVASGIVDNIPYTATMIPIVHEIGARGVDTGPLWWSLALGADLGGNATVIGASANVVIVGLAARAGHQIGFRPFLRWGVPTVLMSILIASAYVWALYLR